jgi:hypothetical protein
LTAEKRGGTCISRPVKLGKAAKMACSVGRSAERAVGAVSASSDGVSSPQAMLNR